MKKTSFFFIALFLNANFGYSQLNNDLFFSFDQVQRNIFSFTPSLTDTASKFDFTFGNRSYTGVYSGISSRFLNGNYYIKTTKNQFHSIGFQLYQQNLGQYIWQNSSYLQYAYRARLSKKVEITSGVSFGLKSLVIDPSDAGGGGNSIVPDANLGMGIITRKLELALGYKSFLNSDFIFDQYRIKSMKSYHASLLYKQQLNVFWDVKTLGLLSMDNTREYYFQLSPVFEWNSLLQVGAGFRSNKGTYLQVGFTNVKWASLSSDLTISYIVKPLLEVRSVPNNVFEVILSLRNLR